MRGGSIVNKDIAAGKWEQLKGAVKEKWGKLTDDELTRIKGKRDKLQGLLRERYGYSEEKTKAELDRFYEQNVYDDGGQESILRGRSA
jgi:uncharacterized protein YjbJ (UPF0337 family)